MKKILTPLISLYSLLLFSQYDIKIIAELDTISDILNVNQEIEIIQSKSVSEDLIFLLDWNNSFISKETPLAKSFSEEYNKAFHLAKNKERGFTNIKSIRNGNGDKLNFFRLEYNQDVVAIKLDSSSSIVKVEYSVKIPSKKFTGYGYTKSKDYYLQYWHLIPSLKIDKWTFYSNKNLNDIPSSKYNITELEIKIPKNYKVSSELKQSKNEFIKDGFKYSYWQSNKLHDPKIYIEKEKSFKKLNGLKNIYSNYFKNIEKIAEDQVKISNVKIVDFLKNELDINLNHKILISKTDFKENKKYDLNILNEILEVYPNEFIYELQLLKILLSELLDNLLIINPREDYWIKDGIQTYMLIEYVEKKYPNITLAGNLSKFPGLKSLYASKLKYNEKYFLSVTHMDRINNSQSLDTPKDSLLKFNERIANKHKSGLIFYDILSKNKKDDFSVIIKNTLKSKNQNSVYYFKNELKKRFNYDRSYIDSILKLKTIDHLNYFAKKNKESNKLKSKPFKLKLGKDIEDPDFNHIYITPIISYENIYDGVNIGAQIHNRSIFKREFNYKFKPLYSVNSKELSGSAIVYKTKNIRNKDLFMINYGLYGNISSYDQNSLAKIYTPFINFNFRESSNLRENKLNSLNLRFLKISNNGNTDITTEYQIFNLKYVSLKSGVINHKKWFLDYQISKSFSKISFSYEFRKLFKSNRELNIRLFTGYFISNKNSSDDYFNFSLDRPTDYLYDYNYYGRSENNGFFSQQIIMAEGGFKSKLTNPSSNNFISTINISSTLWKSLLLYVDLGVLNTKTNNSYRVVYDSGFRFNIIAEYFEIYFPIKSSNGLEIERPNYNEKIRFLFTFEPDVLLGLFRRKWY
ncbi:MAG: hypothetical protein H8E16_18455 [Flavobacteriales bacterium]|nr:hypothetical protein [Flavobacteriales bacterium]